MMMTELRATILLLAAAALARGGVSGQEPAAKAKDEPLLKVAAPLTRDEAVDPLRKQGFHKVYTVKLTTGVPYQIDLVSKDFDAFLRLEDAAGKPLAEDD